MTGKNLKRDLEESPADGSLRAIAKLATGAEWSLAKALASLPEGGAKLIKPALEQYQSTLRPYREAEPRLDGSTSKSIAETFMPLGAKMRPDFSPSQAQVWAASIVMAFSDLPAFIVKAAMAEALHIPFGFPADLEAGIRAIAERKLEEHRRSILRLRMMLDEIHRAAHPQPQLTDERPVEWTREELRKLSPDLRRMGIAGGWITAQMLEEADAEAA